MFDGEPLTLDYKQPVIRKVFPEEVQMLEPTVKTDTFFYTLTGNESEVSVLVSLKTSEVQIVTPGSAYFKQALKPDEDNMYSNAYFQGIGNSNIVETVLLVANLEDFNTTDLIQIDGFITGNMESILTSNEMYNFQAWRMLVNGEQITYTKTPKLLKQFYIPYAGTVYYDSLDSDLNLIFYQDNTICYLEVEKENESDISS